MHYSIGVLTIQTLVVVSVMRGFMGVRGYLVMLLLLNAQLGGEVFLRGLRGVYSWIHERGSSSARGVGRIRSIVMLGSGCSLLKGVEVGNVHTGGGGLRRIDGAAVLIGGVWASHTWSLAAEV